VVVEVVVVEVAPQVLASLAAVMVTDAMATSLAVALGGTPGCQQW